MTPQQFITKWQRVQLSERSASQQHFLDLCELLDQPKPAAADPDGSFYTFERGVQKTGGGDFGIDAIPYFNGSLFADADMIELRPDEIRVLTEVSRFGWEHVEPSIFGTLCNWLSLMHVDKLHACQLRG